jgi:hypothetical protein
MTAVEWLIKELNQKIDFIPMDKWDMIRDIVQQALEIEKEQIIDAHLAGQNSAEEVDGETEIQYFNETFKKENQ